MRLGKQFYLVALLMALGIPCYAAGLVDEGSISFQSPDSILENGQISFAAEFVEVEKLSTNDPIFSIDLLKLSDPARSSTRIKKLLLFKSMTRLQQPVSNLVNVHLEKMGTLRSVFGFKGDPSCLNNCSVTERLHSSIFTVYPTLNLESQMEVIDPADMEGRKILQSLGVESATHKLTLMGRDWSMIFSTSESISYFVPVAENKTDLVIYQIIGIKESSYSIPFLEALIKTQILAQNKNLADYLRGFPFGTSTEAEAK